MDPLYIGIALFVLFCCCLSSSGALGYFAYTEEEDKKAKAEALKKKLIADEKKATEEAKLAKIKADEAAEIARVAKEKADTAKTTADKFIASGSFRQTGEPDILANGEQLQGTALGPINFPCPVRGGGSSIVRYGAKGNYFLKYLPEGTNSFDLSDTSIGGDPAPGEPKQWFARYQCV
jgi:hypothetical protein